MKKGQKINVSEDARYNGQDMDWTETFTGTKKIGQSGEIVFHRSDSLIKEFRAKEICVSPFEHGKSYLESNATIEEISKKYNWKSYVYMIFLPEGTIVDTYSDDEYRFELTEEMDVTFAGIVHEAKGAQKIKNGRMVDTYIKFSDTIQL